MLHCCPQIKRLIKGDDAVNEVTVIERFAAGSSAGAVSQTIIYPMEVNASFVIYIFCNYSAIRSLVRDQRT